MIFDGKGFANKIEEELRLRVAGMGRKPRLIALLDPKNAAGSKYVELKKKMALRLGVEFEVYDKPDIEKWNQDASVDGIMIQLPYPHSAGLIAQIEPKKDVDGLSDEAPFKSATVRAVLEIMKLTGGNSVLVVGSRGEVGRRLVREIPGATGMDKHDFDAEKIKMADVVITCTGHAGVIDGYMVKPGFAAIDVGYPKPEFTSSALAKASFFTPVPGGVGPVTVAMLFKNLLDTIAHSRQETGEVF